MKTISEHISEQRIKDCLAILDKGENEKPIVKERLERLSFQLAHLLDEIEEFRRVVYCKEAAACWLDNNVLKMLSGSKYHYAGWKTLDKDRYYDAPSPASCDALNRGSSNGWNDWKDRLGRSMKKLGRT
jgi:hypothetical protein